MRTLIIANPLVGIHKEKKAVIEKITSHIKGSGGSVDITYIMKQGTGKTHASRASLEGYDAVYAAGGDGTVNEVASGLVGRATPLGIIPVGTGNGFARGLGIPLDTKSIITTLLKNKITSIDTGIISSRYFFATAGIGFDAHIAHDFNIKRGTKTSLSGYFILGMKNYFSLRPESLTLVFDGREIQRTVFGLTVCNTSQYGGGAIIAPQADPKSGKLIAVLFPKFNVFKALPAVKRLLKGTLRDYKDVEYITFETLKIKRRSAGLFQVDGEAFEGDKTLDISVLPSSLKVITP